MVERGEEGGDCLISAEGIPLRTHEAEKLKCKGIRRKRYMVAVHRLLIKVASLVAEHGF